MFSLHTFTCILYVFCIVLHCILYCSLYFIVKGHTNAIPFESMYVCLCVCPYVCMLENILQSLITYKAEEIANMFTKRQKNGKDNYSKLHSGLGVGKS